MARDDWYGTSFGGVRRNVQPARPVAHDRPPSGIGMNGKAVTGTVPNSPVNKNTPSWLAPKPQTFTPASNAPVQQQNAGVLTDIRGGSQYNARGTDYSGVDTGGGGYGAPAPAPPSEEDYLAGDSAYLDQLRALKRALELYTENDVNQRDVYNRDYGTALTQLGWTPDNPETADVNEAAWNWEDQNTASGRSYQNQLNDFAARGMLQSSGYARSMQDLKDQFTQQLGSINTSRDDWLKQQDLNLASQKAENVAAREAARNEAILRRAAQFGL